MTMHEWKRAAVSVALGVVLAAVPSTCPAAAKAEGKAKEPKVAEQPERTIPMDYGPFISTSLIASKPGKMKKEKGSSTDPEAQIAGSLDMLAYKGINIRLGANTPTPAGVCFDTDTLTVSAGWTGEFLDLSGTMLTNHKGVGYVTPKGERVFRVSGLGWAKSGDFTDPRPQKVGQLPPDRRYKGLYIHGDKVILSYRIGDTDVLEMPDVETRDGFTAITRTIRVEKGGIQPGGNGSLALFDVEKPSNVKCETGGGATSLQFVSMATGATVTAAVVFGLGGDALSASDGRARASLAGTSGPATFKIALWKGPTADLEKFVMAFKADAPPTDLPPLCTGGPAHWTTQVTTTGKLGDTTNANAAYVADSLGVPETNPWNSWMRTSGFDFLPDGRLAVCTFNGDVWIVGGINDKLDKLAWKRFATGLYQPLGLRVLEGKIYVCGRDQITRLHDLNNDGEADFYECFNSGAACNPVYHAFAMELQTDAQGNFYYSRCGRHIPEGFPDHGVVFKISPDGQKTEIVATGLRAANGMGAAPDGTILVSDNEGEWTPSSRINLMKPGKGGYFFGYVPLSHQPTDPTDYDKPLCWVPHELDPSSGGEAYIPDQRWGPFKGSWVHTSFGSASLFVLLTDEVGDQPQGAIVKLPLTFATGIMRARFNPIDGQLYVCGVGGGWQTRGTADGAIYRVRYTGKPVTMPTGFHVEPNGVRLTFPGKLDKESAGDDQNWAAECWNYKWAATYGSPDLSAKDPGKAGHDELNIKSATLSSDGKSITLLIPDLKPVMQLKIEGQFRMEGSKSEVKTEVYGTVNKMK